MILLPLLMVNVILLLKIIIIIIRKMMKIKLITMIILIALIVKIIKRSHLSSLHRYRCWKRQRILHRRMSFPRSTESETADVSDYLVNSLYFVFCNWLITWRQMSTCLVLQNLNILVRFIFTYSRSIHKSLNWCCDNYFNIGVWE